MDVKVAFLRNELGEEIYIKQLIGFKVKGKDQKVKLLKLSIYGFHQSSRK